MALETLIARAAARSVEDKATRDRTRRRELARLAPGCIHRGEPTGETVPCLPCQKKTGLGIRLRLFGCALHGQCTVEKPVEGIACCDGCLDKSPPEAPELLPGLADPLPAPELVPVPDGWARRPDVRERHAEALRRIASAALPAPARAEGDGIVIVGGGSYWPMIVIACRMARDVTDLPIQIWHRGTAEPVNAADLDDLPGVELIDATTFPTRILRGWETKALALVHCGFERVLYLDADAYLVADPRPWLALATPEAPFIFWQDLPAQDMCVKWPAFGLENPGIVPVQGGQLAIHRAAAWRLLVVFHWLNQHSDFSYAHGFGDQDCWPPALAATGTPFGCLGRAPWHWPAYLLPLDGKPLIVHRCRGKLHGTAADLRAPHLPAEDRAWAYRDQWVLDRQPVPTAAQWRARRLRALGREPRWDNAAGPRAYNRVAGIVELIRHVEAEGGLPADRLRVLEIGSHRGVSSEAFALLCGALTCVDPWDDEAIYRAFRERMDGYGHVTAIRGRSPEALARLGDAAFDMVYIDAVHEAAALTLDVTAALRVVRPGGWIAGHDHWDWFPEIAPTVRALLGEPIVFADSSWLCRRPGCACAGPAG